jgi:hypothetical protein
MVGRSHTGRKGGHAIDRQYRCQGEIAHGSVTAAAEPRDSHGDVTQRFVFTGVP